MDRDALVKIAVLEIEGLAYDHDPWGPTRAAEAILDAIAPAIRAAALEEAATAVERSDGFGRVHPQSRLVAAAIRALINDPPATP